MDCGVFKIVSASGAKSNRIYGFCFVDTIKHEGNPHAFETSQLFVQAYNDIYYGIQTCAPSAQHMAQRPLLTICVMHASFKFFTHEISQAYVQSEINTQRPIAIRPPANFNLSLNILLQVNKPLYGLPEASFQWYRKYHNNHSNKLSLTPSDHYPCF